MAEKETQVAKEAATDSKYVSRVRTKYVEEVVPYLMKRFNYKNVNQVPKLVKITLKAVWATLRTMRRAFSSFSRNLPLLPVRNPF